MKRLPSELLEFLVEQMNVTHEYYQKRNLPMELPALHETRNTLLRALLEAYSYIDGLTQTGTIGLPCPICHCDDGHKLDCQNAAYVHALAQRIRELEKLCGFHINEAKTQDDLLLKRIRELETENKWLWNKVDRVQDAADELQEALADD